MKRSELTKLINKKLFKITMSNVDQTKPEITLSYNQYEQMIRDIEQLFIDHQAKTIDELIELINEASPCMPTSPKWKEWSTKKDKLIEKHQTKEEGKITCTICGKPLRTESGILQELCECVLNVNQTKEPT